jgi:hypothetical protein
MNLTYSIVKKAMFINYNHPEGMRKYSLRF